MQNKIIFIAAFLYKLSFIIAAYSNSSKIDTGPSFYYYLEQDAYSGYINVRKNTGSALFYQLFSAINTTLNDNRPLLVWLNGGPGCTSTIGTYTELGPYTFNFSGKGDNQELNFYYRNTTWNNNYHMVFVDEPIGSGLSFALDEDIVSDTITAAEDFVTFMISFYEIYPQLKMYPLYLTGESYAGHYIGVYTTMLLQNPKLNFLHIPGISIGDGWVSSYDQSPWYGEYAFAVGVIDYNTYVLNNEEGAYAEALLLSNENVQAEEIIQKKSAGGLDIDNYRYYGPSHMKEPLYELFNFEQFVDYINIPLQPEFETCNDTIDQAFSYDIAVDYSSYYTNLLNENINVLLYVGQNDFNVNYIGVEGWIKSLSWDGILNFLNEDRHILVNSTDEIGGYLKNYENLYFALVYNAGHMVPADQPGNAYEIISMFIDENWLTLQLYQQYNDKIICK